MAATPPERAARQTEHAPEPCMRLSELPAGARARLCHHTDREPAPHRLLDLGFVPDTPLWIVRRAPLGDPVEIEIRGYRVCVRRDDLAQICVTAKPNAPISG